MQVVHALPGVLAGVGDDPVPTGVQSEVGRHLRCEAEHPPQQRVIDPLTAVTRENADEYAKNWEKWLGSK